MITITERHLQAARDAGACTISKSWLGLTFEEFVQHHRDEAEWAAIYISGLTDEERDELERLGCGRAYYRGGKWHRTDGPAIVEANGSQEWWIDGKRHRTDGPAVIWADGRQEWWIDGKRHRTDGPAIIRADGSQEWWIDGALTRSNF